MIKLLLVLGLSYGSGAPLDSIGVETINGKLFVIHKVDEKETLFAISRRYHTTVDAIVQYNSGASAGLEIGQILKVPYAPKTSVNRPADGIVHEVAAKETMFSISKKYGVSIDEIRQWNNLSDNTLSIGQQLVIKKRSTGTTATTTPVRTSSESTSRKGVHTVGAAETMFSISKQYGITVDQLKDWNNLEGSELKVGQTLYVTQPERGAIAKKPDSVKTTTQPVVTRSTSSTAQTSTTPVADVKKDPPADVKKDAPTVQDPPVQPQTIRISESIKNGSETVEGGVAELIEGTEGNRKYLALHRTAPIGTILKVRNEMNNREVFVRVMGKLPDTALTNKVIIRISKSAYDRLGAIDQRFRVEVTYYK
ncbi:LysM peptidoglycan-binding domain-containing protein [Fulvivirgaceae bacterium PWU4]|uniref:LysM peptidoglycan-binding domain-containing protein n=1 Tax=Chryseosolibacter histidini TaxID=2782349 RepID=A0AAP2GNF7_9BACT|nr:LysM peptidoglycan-binding domain-containing protein [Chryseosolibacter histidini]MBT1697973.1 LysM peptidoglycan-binding domain-containing protein [Chryseosolibacter histidini]